MAESYQLELLKKIERSPGITSFYFKKPANFYYKPGQYVKVTVTLEEDDNKGGTRFFTLSSSPSEEHLMITTKMQPSQFKKQLYTLNVGDFLDIRGPYGSFVLQENEVRSIIFIAGGMGITPFRSMIRFAADNNVATPMHLIYSYNTESKAVFLDELQSVVQQYDPITAHFIDSSQQGHIDQNIIKKSLDNLHNTVYYITGPTEMVDEISKILEVLQVSGEDIYKEYFSGYTYE